MIHPNIPVAILTEVQEASSRRRVLPASSCRAMMAPLRQRVPTTSSKRVSASTRVLTSPAVPRELELRGAKREANRRDLQALGAHEDAGTGGQS